MTDPASTVDYFFAPNSPWTYLGHTRFVQMARAAGATVRVRPMDLGQVFPQSGGLPLAKRAPQRQAYRLVELARFAQWLDVPLTPQPRFFPVQANPAAQLIVAVDRHDGGDAALQLTGAVLAAVWAQERDIASPDCLAELLADGGLPAERLAQSQGPDVLAAYQAHTQAAIDAQVFGAPSYVVDGEIFWGQDRLDFLQRKLGAK
ncbi:2-hydroxychromene-2-carboxylate isomerase [Hydrogenophaga sp. OTU3427]|uniref:2-hydroxychromene-2-carboxylate isomerase n=1 Tax=Hydrogenophaga sp. OTU3427 TaxID=3043856 RepID=UPI00313EDCB9